jgi:hypothetical protein
MMDIKLKSGGKVNFVLLVVSSVMFVLGNWSVADSEW